MDEKYWDNVAADYDGEIFSVLANDRSDVIVSKIQGFAGKEAVAGDFGCGVGKFLPVLADGFAHVYAIDISKKLLAQASNNCGGFDNISYLKCDLSRPGVKLKKVDFALSVNVAIMPSRKKQSAFFKSIASSLRKGGHFLLVVPSLESALYADFRLVQWNLRNGLSRTESASSLEANDTDLPLRQGLVAIDKVPTKHYLKEELKAIFNEMPLDIVSIEKVEYSWETEFDKPPKWMEQPYPWDWLVVLEKPE